jgi:acyl-CoA thioester hydrolase
MAESLPVIAFEGDVNPEWVDANRHMSSMAYANLFWANLSGLFGRIGITAAYPHERRLSIFQREAHIGWERELLEGQPITIRSWLIDFDDKRIHHFHEMWNETEGYRAATMEYLSFHIDLAERRTGPIPSDIRANLERLSEGFAGLPVPAGAGVAIRIRKPGEARSAA